MRQQNRVSPTGTNRFGSLLVWVLLVVATLTPCFALYVLRTPDAISQNEQVRVVATAVAAEPSASKREAESYQWDGQKDEPKKIVIDKIGVDSFVQQVGVDANSQIEAPSNIHLSGWFSGSVKPGQPGLSVIDGHVSWQDSDAVFKDLAQLNAGDKIAIELGSGEFKKFEVFAIKQVKEGDSVGVLFSQNPKIKSQLNLITCGGGYSAQTQEYEERLIVSAKLVD